MNCIVEQRTHARRAIQQLGERPEVIETDLISPGTTSSGRWAIEIALSSEGLPPKITEILVHHELTIRHAGPRQSWWHCMAIV